MAKWGTLDGGRHKQVIVSAHGQSVIATLADIMPHKADIKNGAGIDLSPATVKALGLKAPLETEAVWSWA